MKMNERKEIVFYYESRQNPNGDPGFENQPRLMSDGKIMVTDVRLKRTIRDYAKKHHKKTLFVDFDNNSSPTTADDRAKEIVGKKLDEKSLMGLLYKTFDVPLFGGLVTIRSDATGDSFKITGPVQFGLGLSVNQPEIINPTITGRFVGKKTDAKKQHSTFGKFYSVDYALIKFQGVVNPANLSEYWDDSKVRSAFEENESLLLDCIWDGTNQLVTRSKYPQRSIFLMEVTYEDALYNDLSLLVDDEKLSGKIKSLDAGAFDFENLLTTLSKRKSEIKKVRLKCCEEMEDACKILAKSLQKNGIKVEEL